MSINIPHTAFGLVVVESIWPHEKFGYATQTPMTVTKDGGKSAIDRMENPNSATGTRMEFYNYSGEARGYYRIIPMNLTSLSTTSSISGESNFSVSFTMDDIILVGENTGNMDGLRAIIPDILSIVQNNKSLSLGQFDKLRSLGLAAHRITTPSSMFSIEDIVHTGDTVSIWFYNDPKDFQTSFQNTGDKVKDPIMSVIMGSGNRISQYQTTDEDLELALNSGSKMDIIANKAAMNNDIPKQNSEQLKSIADELSVEAVSYDLTNDLDLINGSGGSALSVSGLEQFVASQSSEITKAIKGDNGAFVFRAANDMMYHKSALYVTKNFYSGFAKFIPSGNGVSIEYSPNAEAEQVTYFLMFNALLATKIPLEKQNDVAFIQDALDKVRANSTVKPKFPGVTNGISAISTADAKKFMAGRVILSSILQKRIKDKASKLEKPTPAPKNARISRAHLKTEEHGETGYMIFKGHISTVNSKIQVGAAYEVSITGGGMEYPMMKHTILFDETGMYQGDYNRLVDFPSRISQLNPAKAMVFLINRWMPRQIKWGSMSEDTAAKKETKALHANNPYPLWLRRGNIIITKSPAPESKMEVKGSDIPEKEIIPEIHTRIFTPVHFMNLTRIGEIIRAAENADPNRLMTNATMAYDIQGNISVWQTCKKIAGAANIFELFVDEIGNLMYRPAAEAWERASQPIETPIIFGEDIQNMTYTRSEDTVFTLVDIMPAAHFNGVDTWNAVYGNDFGRATPKPRAVPINNGLGLNPTHEAKVVTLTAPEFYRYGLRYMQLSDFYGAAQQLSQSKAETLLSFYKDPLKRAEVSILGNPSYRVGNTVIIHNGDIKRRSNSMLDPMMFQSWLASMDDMKLRRFMSVDERLIKDQTLYNNDNFSMDDVWGGKPVDISYSGVRNYFLDTFAWITSEIGGPIPADLFPTTLWYYLKNKDSQSIKIVKAYKMAIEMALGVLDKANPDLVPYLRYVRLNNFICMSYYIESVSHSFNQNAGDASTRLTLSYGQDNITVIHPVNMVPLGYLSVERKMKDGYGGPDNSAAQEGGIWRNFLHAYFLEQYDYKQASFMYKTQKMRNTINYQNKLAYRLGRN